MSDYVPIKWLSTLIPPDFLLDSIVREAYLSGTFILKAGDLLCQGRFRLFLFLRQDLLPVFVHSFGSFPQLPAAFICVCTLPILAREVTCVVTSLVSLCFFGDR